MGKAVGVALGAMLGLSLGEVVGTSLGCMRVPTYNNGPADMGVASDRRVEMGSNPASRYKAAAPATWGLAMEVPCFVAVPVPSMLVETIATPGAKMSTQEPKLLNQAMLSFWSVAPTVMALAAEAGLVVQASTASFPAATTMTTPFPLEVSTASFMGW